MFKFVILAALCAVAAAGPGFIASSPHVYSSPLVHESVLTNVGSVVRSVPTAVSHQSQTIIHGQGQVLQPIVAPVVKTYAAAAPLVRTYSYPAGPAVVTHSVPLAYAPPLTYVAAAAAPVHVAASSPLTYTATTGW